MGNDTASPNREAEEAAAAAAAAAGKSTEVRYSIEDLKESAVSLLGVDPNAIDGAFFGDERKTVTLAQAKKAVDVFLKRPATVVEDDGEDS